MPRCHLPDVAESARLSAEADDLHQQGTDSKDHDDDYILSTVFSPPSSSSPESRCGSTGAGCGIGVLVFVTAMLIAGLVFVLALPIA